MTIHPSGESVACTLIAARQGLSMIIPFHALLVIYGFCRDVESIASLIFNLGSPFFAP